MAKQYSPAEKKLCRTLLIELLAHQFCFPVQWIKVQDTLFKDFATRRLIEVGPSPTLTNLAKTTLRSKSDHELNSANSNERTLLSYAKDCDEIYYRSTNGAPNVEENEPQTKEESSSLPIRTLPTIVPQAQKVHSETSSVVVVPNIPITALDIICSITALALKGEPSKLPLSDTIRALCGGRSTVQNEIVGDLTKEFGALPEHPEDIDLVSLGSMLTDTGKGSKFGACTLGLVGKMASSKFPVGVTLTQIRRHLQTQWGFQEGVQSRVLLQALHTPSSNRFASEAEVNKFFDSLAAKVLEDPLIKSQCTFDNTKGSNKAPALPQVAPPEMMTALKKEQERHDDAMFKLYARRLRVDVLKSTSERQQLQNQIRILQRQIDSWRAEHDDVYEKGIAPRFDARKARTFESSWHWALQDLMFGLAQLESVTNRALQNPLAEIQALLATRATPQLLDVIDHRLRLYESADYGLRLPSTAAEELRQLREACAISIDAGHVKLKYSVAPSMPLLEINERGSASTREVERPAHRSRSPTSWDHSHKLFEDQHIRSEFEPEISTTITSWSVVDTWKTPSSTTSRASTQSPAEPPPKWRWQPQVQTRQPRGWIRNDEITRDYLRWFDRCAMSGLSLTGKVILVTGAGKGSIGAEVVTSSLAAGAKVILTTSSYSKATLDQYQAVFKQFGARGSSLKVLPFNGGSQQDVQQLVDYIYDDPSLGHGLDFILPFAALGEAGRTMEDIDSRSEVAHRIMLTNVLRMLGAVKRRKLERGLIGQATYVLLPLSPNHGSFGADGMYAESKLGLEAILNKWWSEDWQDYLSVCGLEIGWTRGTGLMNTNDILAAGLEDKLGIRTFSAKEMAWYIVGLMDSEIAALYELEAIRVDLTGGLSPWTNLKPTLGHIQQDVRTKSDIAKALFQEQLIGRGLIDTVKKPSSSTRKARLRVGDLVLPDADELAPLNEHLSGMVDLDRVPVVVGIGEAGPCGSSRTRWEAETYGTFTIEGCLELAWIMGLVRYHRGTIEGQAYCGWLDQETGSPISDVEIKFKYEEHIIANTGIRLVERKPHDFVDPDQESSLHEVLITEDLEPLEVPMETARDLSREHGDNVFVEELINGQATVTFRTGTRIYVPKAKVHEHAIGAQMPSGWNPSVYGIPDEIVAQVDPVTLYSLVATVEALLSAGITDPFELYEHVHVSEVGNAVGSAIGAGRSLHAMYAQRYVDRQVQKDILAETFINTTAAWINMLLLGSSGPIRTPVGACATALESVDTGADLICNGKAKVVLVGGSDSLERSSAQEFANMQATLNVQNDAAAGRDPKEASRPATNTRNGFVQGEGSGVQLLTTASLALKMGLPIRAVIALSHTASDQIGRSVPAPGKGLLTVATAEKNVSFPSPLLNYSYRRRQLHHRIRQIEVDSAEQLAWHQQNFSDIETGGEHEWSNYIRLESSRNIKDAKYTHGNMFWRRDPSIAPLRGALAVWGLTVDDITVASLHGTSTKKNDTNETAVLQAQLSALGRSKGNVLPCVFQKSLIGHGLGAAGAFALNGCIQMNNVGVVPGNRNADDIDVELSKNDLLFYPSKTYRLREQDMKAFSVTSFGFGQKGAQVIGVHPRYLFASIDLSEYSEYRNSVTQRMAKADQTMQAGLYGGKFVRVKQHSYHKADDSESGLLNR